MLQSTIFLYDLPKFKAAILSNLTNKRIHQHALDYNILKPTPPTEENLWNDPNNEHTITSIRPKK